MKFKTKREAAEAWVREFDCIDAEMIGKLMQYEPDDWYEVFEKEGSYTILPMWGYMWQVHDPCDTHWLDEMNGIDALEECGFRVYESETFGTFFGIDGCGYDFYEAHWIPLYEKRGLHWSEEDNDELDI